jgi:hypothetical protein
MFKQLVLMAIFALSIGTSVASFSRPAHAAIDAYMCFQEYDNSYFDTEQDE